MKIVKISSMSVKLSKPTTKGQIRINGIISTARTLRKLTIRIKNALRIIGTNKNHGRTLRRVGKRTRNITHKRIPPLIILGSILIFLEPAAVRRNIALSHFLRRDIIFTLLSTKRPRFIKIRTRPRFLIGTHKIKATQFYSSLKILLYQT
nr:MAG TPA: hypothetical protein [Microviridae sp.]